MRRALFWIIAICFITTPAHGTDYAKRFPTNTALPVVTPTTAKATYLRLDFENADSAPSGTGFYKVSDSETRLYVDGTHIHTWKVTGVNFAFVDGNNFVFVDGNNFVFN